MAEYMYKITGVGTSGRYNVLAVRIRDESLNPAEVFVARLFQALLTQHKLTRVRSGLVCRVNNTNPGSTRVSLEKCHVNTTWVSFNSGRTRVQPGLICAV